MSGVKHRLRGVLGFPLTPFRTDLSLDLEGLEKNVDAMARYPFCALVAAGGMGEVYSLSVDEAVAVVSCTVQVTAGRMPVMGGVGFNTPLAVETARRMEKAGADCLLVLPPYYAHAPEAGLFDYYQKIGEACGLPLAIYSRDWAAFTPAQVARLAERVPSLEIWKDGQGDMRKYQRIMVRCGDRLAWLGGIGDDCVPGYFAIGVEGYTSSISNIAPKLSLRLAEAGLARDFAALDALMQKYVHPLYAIRERHRGYEVAVMKKAVELLGHPAGPVRPPLMNVLPEDVEDLRAVLETYRDVM